MSFLSLSCLSWLRNPPVPWAGISGVFHGDGGHSSLRNTRVCSSRSSRSSMGRYFTGTGTCIYSGKLVIRPRKLSPRTVPAKYSWNTSMRVITRMKVFHEYFAGMVRGDVKYSWNTRPWNWGLTTPLFDRSTLTTPLFHCPTLTTPLFHRSASWDDSSQAPDLCLQSLAPQPEQGCKASGNTLIPRSVVLVQF